MHDSGRIAGLELGGTKAICVLWQDGAIIADVRIPTTTPDETMAACIAALSEWWADRPFDAIGIATFGPVTLDPAASDYGHIRVTPKPHWQGADVLPRVAAAFACPVAIDTDVNAPAMAEYVWGAGQGCHSVLYVTIGTGIGGGAVIDGRPLHGRVHPEMGHIALHRQPGDNFAGSCRFHGDCVEGLLAGPALAARFGAPAETVAADDPRWDGPVADMAGYLAALIHMFSPDRILVGGGVGMGAGAMLDRAIAAVPERLGGYYADLDDAALRTMIRQPGLGDQAGPLGAIITGLQALDPVL